MYGFFWYFKVYVEEKQDDMEASTQSYMVKVV